MPGKTISPSAAGDVMAALIGWLTNKAIGWAIPGLSANALYIIAALLAIGLPSVYAWHRGEVKASAAVAVERSACELSKAEDARNAALTMADLLDRIARHEEEDDGKTPAEKCRADPFCRGGKK